MNSLSTCIDVRDLWLVLHPKWDETPSSHRQLALTVSWINANDRDLIGRRYVIARRKV